MPPRNRKGPAWPQASPPTRRLRTGVFIGGAKAAGGLQAISLPIFPVILNAVQDLNYLKIRDYSLRSE
jgi:hypothetical protein